MWEELSEERWKNHRAGPDESENTIQCVQFDIQNQLEGTKKMVRIIPLKFLWLID
jgi:hypothetical protein